MKKIITVDGPAGSGKEKISKYIARKYKLYHLDSGILYRRLAYELEKEKIEIFEVDKIKNDDLIIKPSEVYITKNNKIRTDFDHRIAMSFAVMGSKVGNLNIEDGESINTSFPNFIEKFNNAGGNIL